MNARQKAKFYKKKYHELQRILSPKFNLNYTEDQMTPMVVQSQADGYYVSKEMTIAQAKTELLKQLAHDIYDKIDVDIDYRARIVHCRFDYWVKNRENKNE